MNLREAEHHSIRAFLELTAAEGYLSGRVLDYGCGKQPYRDIVKAAGGEYVPFDRASHGGNVSGVDIGDLEGEEEGAFTAILCNQVFQYVWPEEFYGEFFDFLEWLIADEGVLVATYPVNWPEVESADLHRFTKVGIERLLTGKGFTIIRHDFRHGFQHEGVSFTCGYGVIARV
jgi:Methyltransferase domain